MANGPDPLYVLRGSQSSVTSVKFQHSDILYSGDQDGNIYVWDMTTKRPKQTISAHPKHSILCIEFINNRLMTHGRDGVIQFWDKENDGWSKAGSIKAASLGYCSAAIGDNKLFVPCETVSVVEIFDLNDLTCIGQLKPDNSERKFGMCMAIRSVEGTSNILVGYENGCIALWDTDDFKMKSCQHIHSESVMCFDYCSLHNVGISGSADEKVVSWSISESGGIVKGKEITVTNPGFNNITIRQDGKIVATAGWDSNIRIFSVKKLRPLAVMSYHKQSVQCVTFSPDNTLSCGSKDTHISLWDIYKS